MKNRIIIFILITLLIITLSSCNESQQSITDCGAEVVALMAEMVESDEYLKLYNLSDAYNETINQVREGDYSTPYAIYELTIPDDELFDERIDEKIFVNDLYNYVHSSGYISFASRINQNSGLNSLAVAAAFAGQMTFVSDDLDENKIYLYVFENGYPIAVTFVKGKDNSFRAVGNFIINDKFITDNEESIKESCKNIGIDNVTVTKQ